MAEKIVLPTNPRFQDLTGRTFGRLTVEAYAGRNEHRHHIWTCLCSCGNTRTLETGALTTGNTRSCGCLHRDSAAARASERNYKHGWSIDDAPHAAEYRAWCAMRARCYHRTHRHYANYGGRGIVVCERWRESFANFYADMGPKPSPQHSIDRIDSNGNYEPENCRWATRAEQNRNSRHNHLITFNGETLCLTAWAERIGIKRATLDDRLRSGWSIEKALTTPLRH